MNIKVFQNRKIEKDYFYNEGTQNENKSTVLTFEVPLGYEDFSKRIVFITEDGNFWDYIPENEYEIKNNITKYETVEAYLWLTKDDQDFRSQNFELNFYDNENPDNMTPSEEQVDGFNTLIAELELKINEINELKPELDKALEKIENYDTDLQGIKNDIAKRLTEEDAKKIFYTETEVDEMIKEIQKTNEYQSEIIDQFKNEFKQITVSGDSIYIPDAAELPMELVPYGEPVQTVIPEELGTTIEGESVVVADGDANKEVKDVIYGMSKQNTTEGYQLFNVHNLLSPAINVGITVDSNDYVTGTTTDGREYLYDNSNWKETLKAGKYSVIVEKTQDSTNIYSALRILKNDGTVLVNSGSTDLENNITIKTFVLTEETTIGIILKAFDGIYRLSILEGIYTTSNLPKYEPYTNGVATPNTENPRDIEVVEAPNMLQVDETNWELTDNRIKNLARNEGVKLTKQAINLKANITYYLNFVLLSRPTTATSFTTSIDNIINDSLGFPSIEKESYFTIGKVVTRTYTPTKDETLTITMWGNTNSEIFEFQYWITTVPNAPYLKYGHIGLVQRGKNKLDISNITAVSNERGLSAVYNKERNSIIINGTVIEDNATVEINMPQVKNMKFKKGITKILFKKISGSITGEGTLRMFVDGWNKSANIWIDANVIEKITTYQQNDGIGYSCSFRFDTGVVLKDFEVQVMITDLDDTSYEPYIEPKLIPINLNGNSIAKVGEIADLLNIGVDGSVSIKNLIKHRILNGSENWYMANNNSANTNRFVIGEEVESLDSDGIHAISNKLIGKTANDLWLNDIEGIGHSVSQLIMRLNTSTGVTNASTLKTWLAENNIECYSVGSEETIKLPSIEPITLFEGTNVFELETNLGTTLAVTYNYVTPSPSIDRPSEIFTVQGEYETELKNEDESIINTLPLTLTNELLGEIVTLTEEEATNLGLDGAGKYRRTDYGRYVFTGDENFTAMSATKNTIFRYQDLIDIIKKPESSNIEITMYSNYFRGDYSADYVWTNNVIGVGINVSGAINIGLGLNSQIKTVDELKALFKEKYESGNAIEFIYPLQTPTYEKITDETELQQLSAYDKQIAFFGINNINTYPTDDLVKAPLKIHATYSKSNKLTIQSLEDRLASLESQVTNLQDNQI